MDQEFDIAIVGMAGRFPGARNLDEFWRNLAGGVESIARLSRDDMIAAGVSPETIARPDYVKASPVLDDPAFFDATFFGFSPGEAATMDPQHRLLLEIAHAALEDAGCDPRRFAGRAGVFMGSAMNTYFMNRGLATRFAEDYIPTLIVNDKDFLATRISYKLGLRGPSMTVQTACSTSLVAIHLARQSLLNEESDLALAGGVSVRVPHRAGYFYDGGGVVSPDGHVRAFDAGANGTVFGSGAGVVVLRRLADALAEGDPIHAVLKGSAVNNDGAGKAGYTAPSVDGQADCVVEAIANAGIGADEISYVEAHGSGTPVGDPIEVLALTKAFRNFTQRRAYCAIGSVKTNVGHLDAAAGIAGVIKTVLALKHRQIPPTLHYTKPNPEIDFPATPFYVTTTATEWRDGGSPRHAGVMATGMGGTNAHVILGEAPEPEDSPGPAGPHVLTLSARTSGALGELRRDLAAFLQARSANGRNGALNLLASVARTLQTGRTAHPHRQAVVCNGIDDAIAKLNVPDPEKAVVAPATGDSRRPIVFLFPGIGDHYVGMGEELYERFEVFRREVDRCAKILQPLVGIDVRELLYPPGRVRKAPGAAGAIDLKKMLGRGPAATAAADPAAQKLDQTVNCQPALFTIEYALARLWMHWGAEPDRIVGHSMGEYVAACLAGVFPLEDALRLVATRARLVNELPRGAMLAVMLPEEKLLPLLDSQLSLALINGPALCVVAGPVEAMTAFQSRLKEREVLFRPVRNAHAFHSKMLDPIVEGFTREIRSIRLQPPRIPFISNVTGTWITPAQAVDPLYWVDHARRPARFSDALAELWKIPDALLLEVGAGHTLGVLAMQHPARAGAAGAVMVSSLRHDYENHRDPDFILGAAGRLWVAGADIKWEQVVPPPHARKISLPTYPFDRQRHWLASTADRQAAPDPPPRELSDWFYVPSWERTEFPGDAHSAGTLKGSNWLIIADESPLAARFRDILKQLGAVTTVAWFGPAYARRSDGVHVIRAAEAGDYVRLLSAMSAPDLPSLHVVHLGALSSRAAPLAGAGHAQTQDRGFYSLLELAKAFGELSLAMPVSLGVVTCQLHEVTGNETLDPTMAPVLGACGVIPREYPNVTGFSVDLPAIPPGDGELDARLRQLIAEFAAPANGATLAYRGRFRWEKRFKAQPLPALPPDRDASLRAQGLRPRGVYLITGGTGGIGLTIAKYLAETCQARLVLTKRTPLPEKRFWRERLAAAGIHDDERRILAALVEIESLGGEVEVRVCEAADEAGMRQVVADTVARHGGLHGVIHAAGVIGLGLIQVKTRAAVENVFTSKVAGTLALHHALEGVGLDFIVFTSSLAAVTTPYAHADYCAAHAFMDAFARYREARAGGRVLTINWPIWNEVGILANMQAQAGIESWKEAALERGISTRDGVEVLRRALGARISQLIVSRQDLGEALRQAAIPRPEAAGDSAARIAGLKQRQAVTDLPQTELDQGVAAIWSEVLGIAPIGIHEKFFDLGGHSLLAMQIVSRLRTAYQVNFTLKNFFESPTIAEIGHAVQERLVSEIEGLSDAEVTRRVAGD